MTIKNSKRLRISVFRSNCATYAQIIDDNSGKTLFAACTKSIQDKISPAEKAAKLGEELAQKAKRLKVKDVYFDRGKYKYHGRVKALAEGLRKGGLEF